MDTLYPTISWSSALDYGKKGAVQKFAYSLGYAVATAPLAAGVAHIHNLGYAIIIELAALATLYVSGKRLVAVLRTFDGQETEQERAGKVDQIVKTLFFAALTFSVMNTGSALSWFSRIVNQSEFDFLSTLEFGVRSISNLCLGYIFYICSNALIKDYSEVSTAISTRLQHGRAVAAHIFFEWCFWHGMLNPRLVSTTLDLLDIRLDQQIDVEMLQYFNEREILHAFLNLHETLSDEVLQKIIETYYERLVSLLPTFPQESRVYNFFIQYISKQYEARPALPFTLEQVEEIKDLQTLQGHLRQFSGISAQYFRFSRAIPEDMQGELFDNVQSHTLQIAAIQRRLLERIQQFEQPQSQEREQDWETDAPQLLAGKGVNAQEVVDQCQLPNPDNYPWKAVNAALLSLGIETAGDLHDKAIYDPDKPAALQEQLIKYINDHRKK